MKLEVTPVWTNVIEASQDEHAWLFAAMTVRDEAAFFRAAKTGGDGLVRFYDGRRFKTGWLIRLRHALSQQDPAPFTIELTAPVPRDPLPLDPDANLSWLRPYQREAALKMCGPVGVEVGEHGPGGVQRGVVDAPVGAGKTEAMIACTLLRPGRWLILAHRDGLITQAGERYTLRTGRPFGRLTSEGEIVYPDGSVAEPDQACVAGATFQLVHRHLNQATPWARYVSARANPLEKTLETFDGVIADECHTVAAVTTSNILARLTKAWYRIGFSGTPANQGDLRALEVGASLGPVRYRISNEALLEMGHVSPARVQFIPIRHRAPTSVVWQGVEREMVVKSQERLQTLLLTCLEARKPGLVFVGDIKSGHLARVREGLDKIGLRVEAISGKSKAREAAIKRLRRGDLDMIVCTEVFQEGVDIPELESVVVACGGKSAVATIQRLGRGSRVSEGKDHFQVWDFYDYVVDQAPDGARPSSWDWIEDHCRERARAYHSQGHEVSLAPLGDPPAPFPFSHKLSTKECS